ncbi:hypothetical protein D3C81_2071970 [compost metagenome]
MDRKRPFAEDSYRPEAASPLLAAHQFRWMAQISPAMRPDQSIGDLSVCTENGPGGRYRAEADDWKSGPYTL